ncbi:MAG: hypothetical protein JWR26_149 [Pedosphaera sp.]|nr:hypothetical protein [Pedosphaera sp.]
MDQWAQKYVDEDGPACVIFKKGGLGEMRFLCANVSLDWQYDKEADRVDFTFEGYEEMDEVSGRGWARIQGKQLAGQIHFHLGDDSGFKARKWPTK